MKHNLKSAILNVVIALCSFAMLLVCIFARNINAEAAAYPGSITLDTCIVTPSYTTIRWKRSSYATKYKVEYKKQSESSYKSVTTSNLYYDFYGFSDTTYNFKITPCNGNTKGNTKSFSFKNYHAKVNFRVWYNSQNGATQLRCSDVKNNFTLCKTNYKVSGYQAAKVVNGSYKLLKTIGDTTYSVTSVSQPHVKQRYAMRCYVSLTQPNGIKTQYFTDYKTMDVVPTPDPVSGVSTSVTNNTVRLTWNAPKNGADGYRIYMSRRYNFGKWSNWSYIKTIKSGDTRSYSFKGSQKTAYRFKVAAISFNTTYSTQNQINENESNLSSIAEARTSGYYPQAACSYKKYSFGGYDGIILVGDSRYEYMSRTSNITSQYSKTTFIALSGSGYDWLKNTAVPKLKGCLGRSDKKYIVVFNHGINDLENYDKYKSLYNGIINSSAYSRHSFFFMSVNPVFDGCRVDRNRNGTGTTNAAVEKFNSGMKALFSANRYLDCCGDMMLRGYDSYDGIHYTDSTNRQIMNYLLCTVKSRI